VNAKGLRENNQLRAIHTEQAQLGEFMNMNEPSQRCLKNTNETPLSLNFGKQNATKKYSFAA
jgi:hypothetical protein